MKKLGKKRATNSETVQAYACMCVICACKSCASAYVSSTLESGAYSQAYGNLMIVAGG